MTDDEIAEFIERSRTATMATVLPDGRPHLVAMWYAVVDGEIWFETKAKSQKAVNLRRNPRASFLVQDGDTYDSLRGVVVQGEVDLVDDTPDVLEIGNALHARYGSAYGDDPDAYRAVIVQQAPKRVGILLPMQHVFSWDFRKLSGTGTA